MSGWVLSVCFLTVVSASKLNLTINDSSSESDGSFVGIMESASTSARIVGGQLAKPGQFAYQVSLKTVVAPRHYCGGFIITNQWIGTAAHCVVGKAPWNVVAIVGAVKVFNDGTSVNLARFVTHPEYDNKLLRNDIALIKTLKKIDFSPTIQPVQLGGYFVDEANTAIVSGWGYTSYPGLASPTLQWMEVETLSNDACKKKMKKSNAEKIYDSSLCAEPKKKAGSCLGDSGGPIVSPFGALIGIISWGVPCSMGYPDVYSRITSFHGWIDSVIDFN